VFGKRSPGVPLLILIACGVAQANIGTGLMVWGMLHLFFGNLWLGIIEGTLLALLFRTPWIRAIPIMIVANYVSAWIGILFVLPHTPELYAATQSYTGTLFLAFALAFVGTVLLEWPFALAAFYGKPQWLKRGAVGNLAVQAATALFLVPFYLYAIANEAMLPEVREVALNDIPLPEGLILFFVGREDGAVHRLRPFEAPEKVSELPAHERIYELSLEPLPDREQERCLIAKVYKENERPENKVLLQSVQARAFPQAVSLEFEHEGESYTESYAPALGEAWDSDWVFENWHNFESVVRVHRESRARFPYQVAGRLLGTMGPYNVVQLPMEQALCSMSGGIYVLDTQAKQMARIADGDHFVAMLE